MIYEIKMMDKEIMFQAQDRMDNLIKPVGSFASLEKMVVQAAGAQGQVIPEFPKKAIISFSGKEPTNTLQVLAKHVEAKLISIVAQGDLEKQAVELAEILSDDEVGIAGISLPEWEEEEVYGLWELIRNLEDHTLGIRPEKLDELELASAFYQAAAAKGILIMLDGPASLLAAVLATRNHPTLREYLILSREDKDAPSQEMVKELGLTKGMSTSMKGDGGLSAAFGLSLFDAAIRTTREIATFAEAQVEYAYNAKSRR